MNEQTWLTSNDPAAMLRLVEQTSDEGSVIAIPRRPSFKVSDRKLRLFIAAVERMWWGGNETNVDLISIKLMEKAAESESFAREGLSKIFFSYTLTHSPAVDALECVRIHNSKGDPPRWANLLRDIFGNPFRPVELPTVKCAVCLGRGGWEDPEEGQFVSHNACNGKGELPCPWLTWNHGTIPRMAEVIYRDRRFEDMPILADVLEEAGCANEDILMHCRGMENVCNRCDGDGKAHGSDRPFEWSADPDYMKCPVCKGSGKGWRKTDAPHVRGCWVLDLLLGKS